jgi:hypothetical protein
MKIKVVIFLILACGILSGQSKFISVDSLISEGKFNEATRVISEKLNSNEVSVSEKIELNFKSELIKRILLDFNKNEYEVKSYIKEYMPDFTESDFEKWKAEKQIEFKNIDGTDRYFHSAARNFFRLNPQARKIFAEKNGLTKDGLNVFLENYIPKVLSEIKSTNSRTTKAKKIKLNYTITVPANTIPDGEMIRCWMPFPKLLDNRQFDIELKSINPGNYIISESNSPHRTVYLEKISEKDKETVFNYELTFYAADLKYDLQKTTIKSYQNESELYKKFTSEEYPHIVFTDRIRNLSQQIIGSEKNPVNKARKIYKWINDNIPWASAREYSTINNISDYCLVNRHGDCGIQSLLFITLCRYNGIPAKWQSGWMLHPGEVNLHDWAEIYFEGIGWIPVDQSFGLQDLRNEDEKWFFFGGLDAYHLVVNDDISQNFFPVKIYPRSETVDFQRGELEWRGGNLYFDKWDYNMEVEYE